MWHFSISETILQTIIQAAAADSVVSDLPSLIKGSSLPETLSLVLSTLRFLLSQLLNRVVRCVQSFELVFRIQVSVIRDKTASRHLKSNQLQVKQVQQNQLFLKQLHLQDQQPQEKHQPTGRQHQQVWS